MQRGLNLSSSSSTKSTETAPFSFVQQDLEKVKQRAEAAAKTNQEKVDFYKSLRSYPDNDNMRTADLGKTKPSPFSFVDRPARRPRIRSASAEPTVNRLAKVDDRSKNIVKARPMPHFGVPVLMPVASKKSTRFQPFSFEDRDQDLKRRKEERIREILEQERAEREFKANPLPDLTKPMGIPTKEPPAPTAAKPFYLEV